MRLKGPDILSHIGKGRLVIALSIVLFLAATVVRAEEQKTAEAQTANEQKASAAIEESARVGQVAEPAHADG
jgi:hypothetical protein